MISKGRVLVIAGSDCSGGAGLEADQKVLAAHQCYAMTATTALTVQNTTGVKRIHIIPSDVVGDQISACIEDIGVDVIKTGMLASAETVKAVADLMARFQVPLLVVDPVTVSTSGAKLLPPEALLELIQHLLPRTTILTPNILEAAALLAQADPDSAPASIRSVDDVELIAHRVKALGPAWVLVKGGHLPLKEDLTIAQDGPGEERKVVVDVLVGPDGEVLRFQNVAVVVLSEKPADGEALAAIAAHLAKGVDVPRAVRAACRYVEFGIRSAPGLGAGHGPLNHFHAMSTLPFSQGYFVEYLLEHPAVRDLWAAYVSHPFVLALGNGTLPVESFKGYIIQDYLYLFSRANALAAYKSKDRDEIERSSLIVTKIAQEMTLHLDYCRSFGISEDQILATEEHQGKSPFARRVEREVPSHKMVACTSYTRYLLEVGQSEDWLALQMALAPCLLGYGAAAKALEARQDTVREGNMYWKWIENYAGLEYTEATKLGSGSSKLPHLHFFSYIEGIRRD
ncbi:putative hydroxymethylpyrimidine/phosphomethylpyrimidine kinase 2 [Escovopsis weberi]|uniref:Putative hydroxymethylpyrimidine/phosphomethylpyrimidine kinase 2 n=1 Tax=Escovopsis weberi TaxID=150374 RepID=A0A0M8MX87_ESCWE|nr:putative hydroxymethylpyrimidine/phosphomethylpyrimidine kinase 2 [Escovopsis weberi]